MNAGCYGSCIADHFELATVVTRDGSFKTLDRHQLGFFYRGSELQEDMVITEVRLRCERRSPAEIENCMESYLEARRRTQPTGERTAGSTFRNPAGYSSTGSEDDSHELKAWSLIDRAGLRGQRRGGAQMSTKHPNFMINLGTASATDLEVLGESVRQSVFQKFSVMLEWEIVRVGETCPPATG